MHWLRWHREQMARPDRYLTPGWFFVAFLGLPVLGLAGLSILASFLGLSLANGLATTVVVTESIVTTVAVSELAL